MILIWNGEKCDRKWFSVIQNGGHFANKIPTFSNFLSLFPSFPHLFQLFQLFATFSNFSPLLATFSHF